MRYGSEAVGRKSLKLVLGRSPTCRQPSTLPSSMYSALVFCCFRLCRKMRRNGSSKSAYVRRIRGASRATRECIQARASP